MTIPGECIPEDALEIIPFAELVTEDINYINKMATPNESIPVDPFKMIPFTEFATEDINYIANHFQSHFQSIYRKTDTFCTRFSEHPTFVPNAWLEEGNPCYDKFKNQGMEKMRNDPAFYHLMLVFHGTQKDWIPSILQNGLDPNMRSRQAHGPGEYFAKIPMLAEGYCDRGCKTCDFFEDNCTCQNEMAVFVVALNQEDFASRKDDVVVVSDNNLQLPIGTLLFDYKYTDQNVIDYRNTDERIVFTHPEQVYRMFVPEPSPKLGDRIIAKLDKHLEKLDDRMDDLKEGLSFRIERLKYRVQKPFRCMCKLRRFFTGSTRPTRPRLSPTNPVFPLLKLEHQRKIILDKRCQKLNKQLEASDDKERRTMVASLILQELDRKRTEFAGDLYTRYRDLLSGTEEEHVISDYFCHQCKIDKADMPDSFRWLTSPLYFASSPADTRTAQAAKEETETSSLIVVRAPYASTVSFLIPP